MRSANIVKLPLNTSSLYSNALLAAFIDADGHFSIKLTGGYGSYYSLLHGRVQCVFSINQSEFNRRTAESNVPFITVLASFFQVNINYKLVTYPLLKKSAILFVFFFTTK